MNNELAPGGNVRLVLDVGATAGALRVAHVRTPVSSCTDEAEHLTQAFYGEAFSFVELHLVCSWSTRRRVWAR